MSPPQKSAARISPLKGPRKLGAALRFLESAAVRRCGTLVGALAVLLLPVLPPAGAAHAQSTAQRIAGPTVKVGDTWMYNKLNGWNGELQEISVNTVKSIDARGIAMVSTALDGSNPTSIWRNRDFNLVRIEAPDLLQTTLPHYPNYAFPLWVGKTWQGNVRFFSSREALNDVAAELTGRVVGWEHVTVPAGNFMALKIELKGQYSGLILGIGWLLSGDIEDTVWYVPEIRNAVRYEYKDTNGNQPYNHEVHELVRYWLAP